MHTQTAAPEIPHADPLLYNPDLAPVAAPRRTWGTYNFAALWISMSVNIPTYMLASGMIAGGMNWKQAIFTVFLGNLLVLVPMLLNAHAGAKYGIPFPVFARASFGVLGANVPAILRALVACGWFAIQTWIGGQAINVMIIALAPGWKDFPFGVAVCFAAFWLLNVAVIVRGIDTVRFLQGWSAPFLLLVGVMLLGWAYKQAGGFGPMLSAPSKFQTFGDFFRFFVPSLTRRGRLLGHGRAEHPGLHALRPRSTRPNAGPGPRSADHHDVLFLHRHRRDFRDRRHLR
jgi:NCS1 family nucleobase:cation symporter-1